MSCMRWWSLPLKQAQRTLGPTWPEQSASDLTQDTWVRMVQGIGGFRGGQDDDQTAAAFGDWLQRTMKRTHANRVRSARTRRRKAPTPLVSLDAVGRSGHTDGDSPSELTSREPPPSANVGGRKPDWSSTRFSSAFRIRSIVNCCNCTLRRMDPQTDCRTARCKLGRCPFSPAGHP